MGRETIRDVRALDSSTIAGWKRVNLTYSIRYLLIAFQHALNHAAHLPVQPAPEVYQRGKPVSFCSGEDNL